MENSIKKKIELNEKHIDYLINLPESGMGYHVVDLILKDGKRLKNRIVLNSQFLVLEDKEDIDPNFIDKLTLVNK